MFFYPSPYYILPIDVIIICWRIRCLYFYRTIIRILMYYNMFIFQTLKRWLYNLLNKYRTVFTWLFILFDSICIPSITTSGIITFLRAKNLTARKKVTIIIILYSSWIRWRKRVISVTPWVEVKKYVPSLYLFRTT
jgi:hypothetical protein